MKSKVVADDTPVKRGPNNVATMRPPSKRKIGSRFKEEDISPANPDRNKGWTGIGCAVGSIMSFGARVASIVLVSRLHLNKPTGTIGKVEIATLEARIVACMPPNIMSKDIAKPAIGPLKAKSNKLFRSEGKDRTGVMQPNVPNCGQGSGIGLPILIFRLLAAK